MSVRILYSWTIPSKKQVVMNMIGFCLEMRNGDSKIGLDVIPSIFHLGSSCTYYENYGKPYNSNNKHCFVMLY